MRKHITEAMFDVIAGTTATYTPAEHNPALGATDKLAIQTIIDQVSGTSPTITMTLEHSNDQRNWSTKTTLRTAAALLTTGANTYIDTDAGTTPTLGFVRVGSRSAAPTRRRASRCSCAAATRHRAMHLLHTTRRRS